MDPLSISSVVHAHFCPVRVYLEKSLPPAESFRYTVCKQISTHLGGPLDPERIWDEIQAIQPAIDPEMRSFCDSSVQACRAHSWRIPRQMDVPVRSERYGLRGTVDKLFGDEPYLAITRSSEAPAAGVYASDRIRIACYLLCVREALDLPVEAGLIEYIPSGVSRRCEPHPRDRRALLRALETARRIAAGEIPRRPLRARCDSCAHQETCRPGPRALSDLW